MIFEPFTEETKKLIADDVETIVNYDPRVVVDSVSVDSTEMGMRIEASITYLPFNVSDRMTFDFDRTTSTIK
jgi:phage baseplate assembly protein W